MDAQSSVLNLEAPEHLRHLRRERLFLTAGWITMLLLLLLAGIGLLAPGYASSRVATSNDQALRVEYYSVSHYGAPDQLTCRVESRGDELRLRLALARHFVEGVKMERVVPAPRSTQVEGESVVYEFPALGVPPRVVFHYRHERFGRQAGSVTRGNGPPAQFAQFVFP